MEASFLSELPHKESQNYGLKGNFLINLLNKAINSDDRLTKLEKLIIASHLSAFFALELCAADILVLEAMESKKELKAALKGIRAWREFKKATEQEEHPILVAPSGNVPRNPEFNMIKLKKEKEEWFKVRLGRRTLYAAIALVALGDKCGVPIIKECLQTHQINTDIFHFSPIPSWQTYVPIYQVFTWLAFSEGLANYNKTIPLLEEIIKNEKDMNMKLFAIRALETLGGKSAISILKNEGLKDRNKEIRKESISSLAKIGDKTLIPMFENVIKREKASEVRSEAIRALGKINATSTIPILRQSLEDNDIYVRISAAGSLIKIINAKLSKRGLQSGK